MELASAAIRQHLPTLDYRQRTNGISGKVLAVEIATAGDASWFVKHPDRRLRIRNMVPGEFSDVTGQPPVGMAWRTIVLEAQPGARSRQVIALPIGTDVDAFADDDLFDLFLRVAPAGARKVIAALRQVKLPETPES